MKFDCKTALLASSLLFGVYAPALAQETVTPPLPQVEADNGGAVGPVLKATDVMAVIDGRKVTVAEVDEWATMMVPGGTQGDFTRRVQTVSVLVSLKAFANEALAGKLDAMPEFKQRMELLRESALQQLYVDKFFEGKPTDAEIKARYDKEIGSLPKEQEVHARHILVPTEEEANALVARLKKGESFEKLLNEQSVDGVAAAGGDLGYFTRAEMVPEFSEAAFALKAGEVTRKPVKSPYGWHIIKVEDVRMKEPPTLEEAAPSVKNMMRMEMAGELQKSVTGKLKVSYPNADVAKAVEQLAQEPAVSEDGFE